LLEAIVVISFSLMAYNFITLLVYCGCTLAPVDFVSEGRGDKGCGPTLTTYRPSIKERIMNYAVGPIALADKMNDDIHHDLSAIEVCNVQRVSSSVAQSIVEVDECDPKKIFHNPAGYPWLRRIENGPKLNLDFILVMRSGERVKHDILTPSGHYRPSAQNGIRANLDFYRVHVPGRALRRLPESWESGTFERD
jgi:hypothetical protein